MLLGVFLKLVLLTSPPAEFPAKLILVDTEPTGFACRDDRVVHDYYNTTMLRGYERGLAFRDDLIEQGLCFRLDRKPTRQEMKDFVTVVVHGQYESGYVPIFHNGERVYLVGQINWALFKQGRDA